MAAVAWSTAVLLVVLLPGFAFILGTSTAEPFSRDATPRSPLAQLAVTVFISLFIHACLIPLCAWASCWIPLVLPPDLKLAMGALLAVSDPKSIDNLATNFASNSLRILVYVIVASCLGFISGYLFIAWKIRRGKGTSLVEHGWLYPAAFSSAGSVHRSVVHVLTSTCHEGRQLMYLGSLRSFGLRADGRFAYMVLGLPRKFFLDLATDDLQTSKETPAIKGSGIGAESLYVDGDSIVNVFFSRTTLFKTASIEASIREIVQGIERIRKSIVQRRTEARREALGSPTTKPQKPEGPPPSDRM